MVFNHVAWADGWGIGQARSNRSHFLRLPQYLGEPGIGRKILPHGHRIEIINSTRFLPNKHGNHRINRSKSTYWSIQMSNLPLTRRCEPAAYLWRRATSFVNPNSYSLPLEPNASPFPLPLFIITSNNFHLPIISPLPYPLPFSLTTPTPTGLQLPAHVRWCGYLPFHQGQLTEPLSEQHFPASF